MGAEWAMLIVWVLAVPYFAYHFYRLVRFGVGTIRRIWWYRQLARVWSENQLRQSMPRCANDSSRAYSSLPEFELSELIGQPSSNASKQAPGESSSSTPFLRPRAGWRQAYNNTLDDQTGLRDFFL